MTNGYIETLLVRLVSELRCHAINACASGDNQLAFLLEKAVHEIEWLWAELKNRDCQRNSGDA
jgi:hypothetical protein